MLVNLSKLSLIFYLPFVCLGLPHTLFRTLLTCIETLYWIVFSVEPLLVFLLQGYPKACYMTGGRDTYPFSTYLMSKWDGFLTHGVVLPSQAMVIHEFWRLVFSDSSTFTQRLHPISQGPTQSPQMPFSWR